MIRIFLDADILLTAAHNPRGKAAFLITLGNGGMFKLATSAYAREEARRNLERKFPKVLPAFTRLVASICIVPENLSHRPIYRVATHLPSSCQATAKLSHPAVDTTSTISGPTTGMGMGVADSPSARTAGLTSGLEGVMHTPEEVAVMRQLLKRGWSQRRIARELGISRHTVSRYQALGTWQPYGSSHRASQLDSCKAWLQQQCEQHHGNAEGVLQELLKQKGIRVSLHTVERAVQAWRESLRQSRQATVRYETRPGQQLQAYFGELWMLIGGVCT